MQIIKTKTHRLVNEKTLIAAVDVGKGSHTGYFRCPNGTDIRPFEFFNSGNGFQKFWEGIVDMKTRHNLTDVIVGFESTGPYAEPLMHYLRSKEVRLVQVNPMHTKRLKELQGNSPNKTDQKDPKVIADIINLGHALSVIVPEGAAAELRRLTQARHRSVERRSALFNQLQHLLFVIFPEFSQVISNIKTKSAKYFLKRWPSPDEILKQNQKAMERCMRKISYGKIKKERIEALYTAARATVGIRQGQEGIVMEIKNILQMIEAADVFVLDLEQKMSEKLKSIPYSQSILSIKGIGHVTAAGLIGEVGDFRQFKTISEIIKLAGLDLFEISSGKHRGTRRISKRGRSLLRKFLYNAAVQMISKVGIMKETYQNYLKRGMIKMKALTAIARKLLRIIFALVRDESHYIHGYSETKHMLPKAA